MRPKRIRLKKRKIRDVQRRDYIESLYERMQISGECKLLALSGEKKIVVGLVISLSDQLDTTLVNDVQNHLQGGAE